MTAASESVDAFEMWADVEPEPTVELGDDAISISRLCGKLWNCTDIMPGILCRQIEGLRGWHHDDDIYQGSTYACGARVLKELIAQNR